MKTELLLTYSYSKSSIFKIIIIYQNYQINKIFYLAFTDQDTNIFLTTFFKTKIESKYNQALHLMT